MYSSNNAFENVFAKWCSWNFCKRCIFSRTCIHSLHIPERLFYSWSSSRVALPCSIPRLHIPTVYFIHDLNRGLRCLEHTSDCKPCCGENHDKVDRIHQSNILTYLGRDKMAAIFQATLLNEFSWMKMYKFRLRFHWSLFPMVQLTIFQHWFR